MASSDKLATYRKKRAVFKRKITYAFKKVKEGIDVNKDALRASVKTSLSEIKAFDNLINELMLPSEDEDSITDANEEIDGQLDYEIEVQSLLSELLPTEDLLSSDKLSNCEVKLPELQCDAFSGEGSSHLNYHTFFSKFHNVVGIRKNISRAAKLTYLKSFLKGYALKIGFPGID